MLVQAAGFARLDEPRHPFYATVEELRRQPPQNFLPQFLRLPEKFLVFDKHPVQFNRLIRRQLLAQQHIADVHRIRQGRFFIQLFKSGRGIVVIHADIVCRARVATGL